MSAINTVKASVAAAPAIAAIRKPLRARLNAVCRERGEPLETIAANETVMMGVFQYVWTQFPPRIRQAVDRDYFIQTCMLERHKLIGDVRGEKKPSLMERLRAKKALK